MNFVCPGQRKSVSCCVASLLPRWIPGCLTPTLHDHKTTSCDCWLSPGLIVIMLQGWSLGVAAKKPLKQCWHCFFSRSNNSIRVWTGFPALEKLQIKWNEPNVGKCLQSIRMQTVDERTAVGSLLRRVHHCSALENVPLLLFHYPLSTILNTS